MEENSRVKLSKAFKKGLVISFVLLLIVSLTTIKFDLNQGLVGLFLIIIALVCLLVVGLEIYLKYKKLPEAFRQNRQSALKEIALNYNNFRTGLGLSFEKCPSCGENLSFAASVKKGLYICPKCGVEAVSKRSWRRFIIGELVVILLAVIIKSIYRDVDLVLFFVFTTIITNYFSKKL